MTPTINGTYAGLKSESGTNNVPSPSATNFAVYLNFKVVSANRANTSEAIQNRTMIFDYDQPINSK